MKAIVCGGGTGGHIYPALSIAAQLKKEGWQVLYLGGKASLEAQLATAAGFDFAGVRACGLRRSSPYLARDLYVNLRGLREAKEIIRDFAPRVVAGTGGYASAPVVRAAQSLGLPTLLHEQNAFPGLANRWLAKRADLVCLTFAAAGEHFPHKQRLRHTGLPVRPAILTASRAGAEEFFAIPPHERDVFTLLITGGSQGSQAINQAALAAYQPLLEAGLRLIHICGRGHEFVLRQQAPSHPRLLIYPYLDRMEQALALADLAWSRAGASFLSEAACLGLPLALSPYPHAANDHQRYNAEAWVQAQAAVMVEDKELRGRDFAGLVLDLAGDRGRLAVMAEAARGLAHPQAAEEIAAYITELA